MEQDLSREFLKVVQEAAIAAAKTMGIGATVNFLIRPRSKPCGGSWTRSR